MMDERLTVLLVEDEPADVHLAKMAFRESHLDADVHNVGDGIEALAFLMREGNYHDRPRPDFILLDLNMPRMDGKAFLKELKSREGLRHIPVVVLTTSEAESDIYASYDLGAAGFVVKPMDIEDFIKVINEVENYWGSVVRRPSR